MLQQPKCLHQYKNIYHNNNNNNTLVKGYSKNYNSNKYDPLNFGHDTYDNRTIIVWHYNATSAITLAKYVAATEKLTKTPTTAIATATTTTTTTITRGSEPASTNPCTAIVVNSINDASCPNITNVVNVQEIHVADILTLIFQHASSSISSCTNVKRQQLLIDSKLSVQLLSTPSTYSYSYFITRKSLDRQLYFYKNAQHHASNMLLPAIIMDTQINNNNNVRNSMEITTVAATAHQRVINKPLSATVANTTIRTTNTATTTTTKGTRGRAATAVGTPESVCDMLPLPLPLSLQQNNEKTIDFNSRRRRGRLRLQTAPTALTTTTMTTTTTTTTTTTITAIAAAALATLCRTVAVAVANEICVPVRGFYGNAIDNAKYVASRLRLLLTLLLSFIVDDFVNIKCLVLSTRTCHNKSNSAAAAATAAAASAYANANATKTPKLEKAKAKAVVVEKRKKCPQRKNMLSAAIANNRCASSNMQIIYAFILCATIILPTCSNSFVSAAKPKSATQLQKQQHQHQHQQHPQHVAGGDYAGGNDGGGILTPPTYQHIPSHTSNEDTEFLFPSQSDEQQLFDDDEDEDGQNLNDMDEQQLEEKAAYETETRSNNETHSKNETLNKPPPLFPKDLFTKEQLENGAVICHIIGVIYMFVALAIVCDEFFVPSLDVIIEKLDITDDVAGATFMAAGGSAPELFTSVIGVFVSFDDVGIGTIVGSAVFNILFVIGMCALFSKTVLTLTWWPLFRDCSFYSISLIVLIYFFRDNRIYWWEALILFSIYIAYVTFMKWNVQVERCVKKVITKNKGNAANSSETSMATQPGGSVTSRAASETRSGPPGSSSGAGATDDVPGKVDEKATQLHAIASLKVLLDATKPQRGGATTSAANHVKINLKETTLADRPNGNIDTTLDSPSLSGRRPSWIEQRVKIQTRKFSIKAPEIEDEPEPLSMAWPDTARKRLTYILVAPLLIPMWLTLPDTRTPRGKKYFPITFLGSILWIAAFSYLMVWWANVAGDTARIPPEVMGLTFLAAGTSIPDLITSVIVARKGFGDMAVSSSVGSNIFDVTVGLPIPWLLYGIFYQAPVEVNSMGMVCSITILFMMLVFVVMSIACFRWRMNKGLGFTMFLLYFVFVAVSLMFEYEIITCPF